ncbi:hypothetical protein [Mesorhizobium sp. LjNodule214]|uniref:hypothetical protein n=1 Tax=Mesorhizobium sp. LjNodule214 TaxID=3342252 RepID=UPI003ECC9A37
MPNTSVPAAGEAMPAAEVMPIIGRFSRRLILGAIVSVPAMGAALAATVPAPAEHPDAELFRLDKELEAAHARMENASEENNRVGDEIDASLPPRPLHPTDWKSPPMPAHLKQLHDEALKAVPVVVLTKGGWEPEPVRAWFDANAREKAQVKATWDEWAALRDERHREHNYDAREEAFNALLGVEWDIGMRICEIPAHTLEGIMVKLRVNDTLGLAAFPENEVFVSIAADIRRLAAEATS